MRKPAENGNSVSGVKDGLRRGRSPGSTRTPIRGAFIARVQAAQRQLRDLGPVSSRQIR
jgi:hypothetical protein